MNPSSEPFAMLSNAALVERYLNRDQSAFSELFRRHREMVYRVCLRWTAHHHDAEDITQETFRRAASAMDGWDSRRPLEPWLVTIAGNRCRSMLATRRRDPNWNQWASSESESIESDVGKTIELNEQIHLAMESLPDEHRRAFELIHQHDLSYPQAARLMGRSAGTVKTWVHRAKATMRDTFRDFEVAAAADSRRLPAPASAAFAKRRQAATASVASILLICFGWAWASRVMINNQVASPLASNPITGYSESLLETPMGGLVGTDLQWATLSLFSQTQWSVSDVKSLQLADWIDRSTPTVRQMSSGVRPLGRTLSGVASLFTWHEPNSRPMLPLEPSFDVSVPNKELPTSRPLLDASELQT